MKIHEALRMAAQGMLEESEFKPDADPHSHYHPHYHYWIPKFREQDPTSTFEDLEIFIDKVDQYTGLVQPTKEEDGLWSLLDTPTRLKQCVIGLLLAADVAESDEQDQPINSSIPSLPPPFV